jgi:hypothetical protein
MRLRNRVLDDFFMGKKRPGKSRVKTVISLMRR